jgi:hypothetical protein
MTSMAVGRDESRSWLVPKGISSPGKGEVSTAGTPGGDQKQNRSRETTPIPANPARGLFSLQFNRVRDGVCGRKLVMSPFLPNESDGRSINRVPDVYRSGSVSARSWGERVTTENTGHTEKTVES